MCLVLTQSSLYLSPGVSLSLSLTNLSTLRTAWASGMDGAKPFWYCE